VDNPLTITLQIRDGHFQWGNRTYIMGILNRTPDSFSDGGQFISLDNALHQAENIIAAGADLLDIGGQSTRPGAFTISLAEELERTIPLIQQIRSHSPIPISIDTTRSEVAQAAIAAGADLVNDVSGGTFDAEMLATIAQLQVPVILMHLRGTPATMQQLTHYQDLIGEIISFFQQQIQTALSLGIAPHRIILDPGIGFAKTAEQSLELLQQLGQFRELGFPLLVGPSRKSFIGHILQQPDPQKRIWGTAATCCAAIAGGADILRVHDVTEMAQVCQMADAIWRKP
jgi:dihydropteroate synthase